MRYRSAKYTPNDLKLFKTIKELIQKHYNVNYDEINLKSHKKEVMEIKHLMRVFMYNNTRISLKGVGNLVGEKLDHTTIRHSLQTWKDWVETDNRIRRINTHFERYIKYGIIYSIQEVLPCFDNLVINKQGDLYRVYSGGKEAEGTNLEKLLIKLRYDMHPQSE